MIIGILLSLLFAIISFPLFCSLVTFFVAHINYLKGDNNE